MALGSGFGLPAQHPREVGTPLRGAVASPPEVRRGPRPTHERQVDVTLHVRGFGSLLHGAAFHRQHALDGRLHLFRRGAERELKWKAGRRDEITYDLRDLEHITAEQRARRTAWLKGEAQAPQTSPSH